MQPPECRQNYSNSKTLNRMNYIDRCGHDYGDPDDVQWLKEDFVDMPLTDDRCTSSTKATIPTGTAATIR